MGLARGSIEWECNRRPGSEGDEIWNMTKDGSIPFPVDNIPGLSFTVEGRRERQGGRGRALSSKWTGTAKSTGEEKENDDAIPHTGATFRKRRDKPTRVQILITASKA